MLGKSRPGCVEPPRTKGWFAPTRNEVFLAHLYVSPPMFHLLSLCRVSAARPKAAATEKWGDWAQKLVALNSSKSACIKIYPRKFRSLYFRLRIFKWLSQPHRHHYQYHNHHYHHQHYQNDRYHNHHYHYHTTTTITTTQTPLSQPHKHHYHNHANTAITTTTITTTTTIYTTSQVKNHQIDWMWPTQDGT